MDCVDYVNTFIAIAPDSAAIEGSAPPTKEPATVAERVFRLLAEHPYRFTSGDVIFTVWADRHGIPESKRADARVEFFAKPQACLRSSDLGKRYGWGVHADAEGKVALYGVETPEYAALASGHTPAGNAVDVTAAMRSTRR